MYSETHPHWGNQGLNFYLYARLCWDPRLDVDGLALLNGVTPTTRIETGTRLKILTQ